MVNLHTESSLSTRKECRSARKTVCRRTNEIAYLDGRGPHEIRQSDYERAKLEITGETERARQLEILGSYED